MQLGELPEGVRVEPYVDQMEVLSRASLFITHCGMNSVSEALYMGVPLLLFPLTGEQRAVARRVAELGAGIMLGEGRTTRPARLLALVREALADVSLAAGAARMRDDLRSCGGPKEAAGFIERAAGVS